MKGCQKSDRFIVVKKRVKARGAKGATVSAILKGEALRTLEVQKKWNKSKRE